MKPVTRFLSRLTHQEHRRLTVPAAAAAVIVVLFWLLVRLRQAGNPLETALIFALGAAGVGYILLFFFVLQPRALKDRTPVAGLVLVNGFLTGLLWVGLPDTLQILPVLLMVLVALTTAALSGKISAYAYIFSAALVPLSLALVEPPGDWSRWTSILAVPVLAFLMVVAFVHLLSVFSAQLERLEMINRVARDVSSTIETPEVISMVCAAIQKSLEADTYYMALHNDNTLRMQLLFDDGKYYSVRDYPLDNGPSSWVVRNRKPILMGDIDKESPNYGIVMKHIGGPRHSQSWMGAPMRIGDNVLGLVAVASYRRSAFTDRELELLMGIAQQAALAVDNAAHHSQVEEASRQDSLTHIYNHGYFLSVLNEVALYARFSGSLFSLIMLDIDHFKIYNDTYGHQVGDEVLVKLVETVQQNIRSIDIIGRWGGEEFAILLQEAGGSQANIIAERIRQNLSKLEMIDREGRSLPAPTISQGIAVFPKEADEVESLVQLADKRLYVAKNRGRNQVEPGLDFWESKVNPSSEEAA